MDKNVTKFGETEIEKHEFHQRKNPILIYNLDINKILVSNKVYSVKRVLNILLVTKMVKKLNRYG